MAVSVQEAILAKESRHRQYLIDLERQIDEELRYKWSGCHPVQVSINQYLFDDDDFKSFSIKYGRGDWDLEWAETNGVLVLTPKAGFPIEVKQCRQ